MYQCSFNRKYCRRGKRKLNYFGPTLKVTTPDEPTLATMNKLIVTRWGVHAFCAAALEGSCEFRCSLPPIPSPQQQKPSDAQVTPPQPWLEHIPHGWSGFYKSLGTDILTRPFLSSWYFCASMEKSSRQCSAFWNTLLKIEQIPNCRISDCWVPDSHRPSAIQSNAYALSSCFRLGCPQSISMLCCTAMIFSVLSVPRVARGATKCPATYWAQTVST